MPCQVNVNTFRIVHLYLFFLSFFNPHLELSKAEIVSISICAVLSPPALRDARLSRYDISSLNASSAALSDKLDAQAANP
jgi:hypothetical protein